MIGYNEIVMEVDIVDVLKREESYTIKDIYELPDGERAELIDGKIYYMAPPSWTHQKISRKMHQAIANYIDSNGGKCEALAAPFAVFLNNDDINYVEPDISVICDPSRLDEKRMPWCAGLGGGNCFAEQQTKGLYDKTV